MASVVEGIKGIISINIKTRTDDVCDQYSRIFMMKMMMIGTMVIGLNWYADKTTCIMPPIDSLSSDFVADACWIQGFYIYEDVEIDHEEAAYYGIPSNLDYTGKYPSGKLCIKDSPRPKKDNEDCQRLNKKFFLQYQYMPFLTAVFALIYYLPYIMFNIMNTDIVRLKENLNNADVNLIRETHFNYKFNCAARMRLRVFGNFLVKMMYALSNAICFFTIDNVMGGAFRHFGLDWSQWRSSKDEYTDEYIAVRGSPKPSNILLPTFGICEVHEGSRDFRGTVTNKHKLICEYSQHILYHYVLLFLWFTIVLGILVSLMGVLLHFVNYIVNLSGYLREQREIKDIYKITFREFEYLQFIRQKNPILYHALREDITKERIGLMITHNNIATCPVVQTSPGDMESYPLNLCRRTIPLSPQEKRSMKC